MSSTDTTNTIASGTPVNTATVTDERVDHYRRHGWAKLPELISASTAEQLRHHLETMSDPDVNAALRDEAQSFDFYKLPSSRSELASGVARSPEMATVALRLTGRPAVRFWLDSGVVKAPLTAGGGDTPWHQDFPAQPFDRCGGLQIWIALEDTPAELGTLQYMNASRSSGPLGRTQFLPPGTSVVEVYPHLADCTVSAPPDMRAGDALVHDSLTMHMAGPNRGAEKRWAYTTAFMPADVLYTGAPCQFSDGLGLEVNREFDHPRFPLFTASTPA